MQQPEAVSEPVRAEAGAHAVERGEGGLGEDGPGDGEELLFPEREVAGQSRSTSSPPHLSGKAPSPTSRRTVLTRSSETSRAVSVRSRRSRRVPGGRYGRCGRKPIASSGGRTTFPSASGHNPAVVRMRARGTASSGPTTRTRVPRRDSTVRSRISEGHPRAKRASAPRRPAGRRSRRPGSVPGSPIALDGLGHRRIRAITAANEERD